MSTKGFCNSDQSWANFVSVDIGSVHEAMRYREPPPHSSVRGLEDMSLKDVMRFEKDHGVRVKKKLHLAPNRFRMGRKRVL